MTMSTTTPNVSFNLGTSSSTVPMATESRIDMSLEEIIKARRMKEGEKSKGKKDSRPNNRRSTRASVRQNSNRNKSKPTTAQKSTGRSQANRKAKTDAKRGITNNLKPTSVDVDKEVYRQQRKASGGKINQNPETGERRRRRTPSYSKSNGKTDADKKVKAKTNTNRNPPPKKAVNAALKAMTNAGYKVPNGMKMIISFEPDAQKKKNNKSQNRNRN